MCVADAWTKMLLWHRAVSLRQHGSCYTKPQIYYLTTLVRRCVSTKQINIPTTYNIVYKLFKKSNSRNIRTTFFRERVINIWNKLPADTDFSSLIKFNRSIASMDFSDYLQRF